MGLTLVIMAAALIVAEEPADEFTPPAGLPDGWFAQIDTSEGTIIVRLLPDQAPQSVAHFSGLAEGRLEWFDRAARENKKFRYYDGTRVHRVVAGRVFEAGRPREAGQIAPNLWIAMEGAGPVNFSQPGRLGMLRDAGVVSGVQFLVTAAAEPRFNGQHPCFGEVLSGLDVIVNISRAKSYKSGVPIDPPTIERIRIFSVGEVAPLPQTVPYVDQRREASPRSESQPRPNLTLKPKPKPTKD